MTPTEQATNPAFIGTLTVYFNTKYSLVDIPLNASVVELNAKYVYPYQINDNMFMYLSELKLELTDEQLRNVDYAKIVTQESTPQTFYYNVVAGTRLNPKVVKIALSLDSITTLGIGNILFEGQIVRQTIPATENYTILAEPFTPSLPLKNRTYVYDAYDGSVIDTIIPANIKPTFESDGTSINIDGAVNTEPLIPIATNSIIGDFPNIGVTGTLNLIRPIPASDTTLYIITPWGTFPYTQYMTEYNTASGQDLLSFLANAKKANSLDFIMSPILVPHDLRTATRNVVININEANNTSKGLLYKKTTRFFTSINVTAMSTGSNKIYTDKEVPIDTTTNFVLITEPDENGGIYFVPANLRFDTLNMLSHRSYGVYTNFKSMVLNAAGTTSDAYIGEQQLTINNQVANNMMAYSDKMNQVSKMNHAGNAYKTLFDTSMQLLNFATSSKAAQATLLISLSSKVLSALTEGNWQGNANNSHTTNNYTPGMQTPAQSEYEPASLIDYAKLGGQYLWSGVTAILGGTVDLIIQNEQGAYTSEVASMVMDKVNRVLDLRKEDFNNKVANMFKNITPVGGIQNDNKLRGKYMIQVQCLQPEDEVAFDDFLKRFGHAVDKKVITTATTPLVSLSSTYVNNQSYIQTGIGRVKNASILASIVESQLNAGVRVWNNLVR
jgi:hypothetical protein